MSSQISDSPQLNNLGAAYEQATETIRRLIAPDGCAWHGVQTHDSLTQYFIEETAEVVEAIDLKLPAPDMVSELGDVLYQVILHASIAERDGEGYGPTEVATQLHKKLVARHPHVFGDRGYMSVAELDAEWEQLKEDAQGVERGTRSVLEGIPKAMPTLAKAAKVVKRLDAAELWQPAIELADTVSLGNTEADEAEIGRALLTLVQRAQVLGVDPDRALRTQLARHAEAVTGEPVSPIVGE